jgi:hypothetical protein
MAAWQRFIGAAVFVAVVLLFALFPAIRLVDRVDANRFERGGIAKPSEPPRGVADFGKEQPSHDARTIADQIAALNDNGGSDFIIIDKKNARFYVFDGSSRLRASSTVLLGAAVGDDAAPDIGQRPFARIRLDEKTTPAGRFVAERGHETSGKDVVWVDYDAAVAIHRVLTANPDERRLQRLASDVATDKRISMGCINLPVPFYEAYVRPMFANHKHPVYILPDTKSIDEVFGASLLDVRRGPTILVRAN